MKTKNLINGILTFLCFSTLPWPATAAQPSGLVIGRTAPAFTNVLTAAPNQLPLAVLTNQPGIKPLVIEFKQRSPSSNALRQQVSLALAKPPQAPRGRSNVFYFPLIAAKPLDAGAQKLLASVIGKRFTLGELEHLQVTREQLLGISFTALCLHSYNETEAKYRRYLASARTPQARQRVELTWNRYRSELVAILNSNSVSRATTTDVARWARNLSTSPLSGQLKGILASVKPGTTNPPTYPNFALTIKPVGSIVPGGIVWQNLPDDVCAKPLASGTYGYEYRDSWDYTVNIPYPCGIDFDFFNTHIEWCDANITLFTVEIMVGYSVGYEITCCGGIAWAYGEVSAGAGVFGASAQVYCKVGGSAVIGAGRAAENGQCTYGFGIEVSIDCSILGIPVGFDVPLAGFQITAPCPPGNPCGFSTAP